MVVFTDLLEFCAVLYVSNVEQNIKTLSFLEKTDNVRDKSNQEVKYICNILILIFQDMQNYSVSPIKDMEKGRKIIIPIFFLVFNILYLYFTVSRGQV